MGEETHRGFGFVDYYTEADAKVRSGYQILRTTPCVDLFFIFRNPLRPYVKVRICMVDAWC